MPNFKLSYKDSFTTPKVCKTKKPPIILPIPPVEHIVNLSWETYKHVIIYGSLLWANVQNIWLLDGIYAIAGGPYNQYTRTMIMYKNLEEIPAAAFNIGLEVGIWARNKPGLPAEIWVRSIQFFMNNTPIGDEMQNAEFWPQVLTNYTFGDLESTWGLDLTPELVNDVNLGIGICTRIKRTTGPYLCAEIDQMYVRCRYETNT